MVAELVAVVVGAFAAVEGDLGAHLDGAVAADLGHRRQVVLGRRDRDAGGGGQGVAVVDDQRGLVVAGDVGGERRLGGASVIEHRGRAVGRAQRPAIGQVIAVGILAGAAVEGHARGDLDHLGAAGAGCRRVVGV